MASLIFLTQGWRHQPNAGVRNSFKFGGLLFLATTGGLALVGEATDVLGPRSFLVYLAGFTISTIVLFFAASFISAEVGRRRLRDTNPYRRVDWTDTFVFALNFVRGGVDGLIEKVTALEESTLAQQRDRALQFFSAMYEVLLHNANSGQHNVEAFLQFIENVSTDMLHSFFERSNGAVDDLRIYRGALYVRSRDAEELLYLAGVAPRGKPHTQQPLPLVSLAGAALRTPGMVFRHPDGRHKGQDFFERDGKSWYRSVAAISVPDADDDVPDLVLTIDTQHRDFPDLIGFLEQLLPAFSVLISNAKKVYGISTPDLQDAAAQMHALLRERSTRGVPTTARTRRQE